MNVTSISDKLKAVVLSGLLTVSATNAVAADNTVAMANQQQPTATQQQKSKGSFVKGSVDEMFDFPLADAFWNNGKGFAEQAKQVAQQSYKPEDPKKMQIINPKIFEAAPNGGAFNLAQFAEYVKYSAYNGDPRFKKDGKPILFPRVIIGVVTPPDRLNVNPMWHKRMADAQRIAVEETQKLAREKGAAVFEIHRIIAEPDEMIYSGAGGKKYKMDDTFVVTVGNRFEYGGSEKKGYIFPADLMELRLALKDLFGDDKHVSTDAEYVQTFCIKHEDRCKEIRANNKVAIAGGGSTSGKTGSGGSGSAVSAGMSPP